MKKYIFLFLVFLCLSVMLKAQSLGFVKLNHVALQVKSVAASRNFYQQVVGLTPIAVPDSLKDTRAWFDAGNGQQIHILSGRTANVVNDRNGSHFAIFVEAIDKAEAYLLGRKIKFHKQVRFDGVVQIYFADPDGYLIEMQQKR